METDNGETFWTNRSPQTYSDGQISVKTPGKDTILDVKAADLLFIREIDRLIQVTFTSQIVSFPFSHWDLPSETTYSLKSCPSVFRRLACVQTFNLFYWTFFVLKQRLISARLAMRSWCTRWRRRLTIRETPYGAKTWRLIAWGKT